MIRDNSIIEQKNHIFTINNHFLDINKENDIFIDQFKKDEIPFVSYNLTDISSFISKNGFQDNILIDEKSSEYPQDYSIMNLDIKDIDSKKIEVKNNYYKKEEKIKHCNSSSNFKIKNIYNRNNNHDNQIFKIEKIRKLGRIKKESNKKGKHDKFKQDNIIRRFKVFIINNIFNYVNNSFNINNNHCDKPKIRVLKKISSNKTKSISKEDNLLWFNSKIKDIFSQNLSTKIVTSDLDFNIKYIEKIFEEKKEKKVIDILLKTVKDMWIVYINDDKNNEFIGFDTLKQDIKKLRESGETEEYIKHFIYIANNYEDIFNNIIPRRKRSHKKKYYKESQNSSKKWRKDNSSN